MSVKINVDVYEICNVIKWDWSDILVIESLVV